MSQRKELIEQAGVYSFSAQLTQLITLVAAVLSRRFLGPTQVGIWATLQLVVEYSKYSSLGIMYGVACEIPYLIGKAKVQAVEGIKNIAFTVVLGGSLLIASGILLFAFSTRGRFSAEITNGLYLISAIVVLQRVNDLVISLLRSHKKFTLASSQMIWSAVVNAFLVASLTYFFKIYGFIWAMILSFLFNLFYIHAHHRFHFRIQFPSQQVKALLAFGIPLLVIGIMTSVLRSLDKIMVAKLLGFEALGWYSIGFMVTSYIGGFSNSIAVVLFPHLQERFSRQDDPRDLRQLLREVSLGHALVMPGLIGLVWAVVPSLVVLFLPQFVPGIEAMKLLSLSAFFLALTQPFTDFLITIRKHFTLFPLITAASGVALVLNYWLIQGGFGIRGVALATSLASWFHFSIIYFFASRHFEPFNAAVKRYIQLLGFGVYLGLVLILIHWLVPSDPRSFLGALLQALLFAVGYAPFLVVLSRRFRLLELAGEKLWLKTQSSNQIS